MGKVQAPVSHCSVSARHDRELLNLILVEPHMKRVSGRSQLTMYRPIRFANLSLLTRHMIDEVDLYTTQWHHLTSLLHL
jgi:hypothetical protein